MTKKIKCNECEEEILQDESFYSDEYSISGINGKDKVICDTCHSEDEAPVTVISFNGGENTVSIGEYNCYTEEADDQMIHFLKSITGIKWHSTDGWRGYYDVTIDGSYKKISDGWVTGWLDDRMSHKQPSVDIFEALKEDANNGLLEFRVFWVFARTSNVFSTACDIYIRDDDEDAIIKWLEAKGFKISDLKEALK